LPSFKYDHQIDLGVDNAHTRVIRLVGAGKHVLELGCASGYMTKVLVERFGCTVVGIDRDPEAAEQARKVCGCVIVGDMDSLDFAGALGEARFDVIVCADVLEHLREPMRAVAALRGFLRQGGYVVASIPNVGHVAIIAELLEGRFVYSPLGLLDETHLRFFTRHSIYDCFERAGFRIAHLERFRLEPEATEFRTDLSRFPAEMTQLLRSDEDSTTYQFVLTAYPVPAYGAIDAMREALPRRSHGEEFPAVATAPARPFDAEQALFEAFLGRVKFLEGERDRQGRQLEEARGRIEHLRSEVDAQVGRARFLEGEVAQREERARQDVERLGHHARSLEEETAALKARQALIEGSVGWRLLERLRRWRSVLMPRRSRPGGEPPCR
jgi:2-polyprenyl-3-methyl-5-hydroxy-6-metoxy-1,4-benzoquinol methylase